MIKLLSRKAKNDKLVPLVTFRAGRYDSEILLCRGGCGTKTKDALSVNGICYPTCAGAECNKKIAAIRGVEL